MHILGKLRSRLLKTSVLLPMGQYEVSVTHLHHILATESRLQHNLTATDLHGKDKMNFRAVERMTSDAVFQFLYSQDDATGTSMYLSIMRDIMDAFLKEDLPPLKRILLLWRSTFFLRLWRLWLQEEGYNLEQHFITSNAFMCVELNTHGLTKLSRKLRDEGRPELFLPTLTSSQPCEGRFRDLRSQTSTKSTVVNVSMREALRRDGRVQLQGDIACEIGSEFRFPR